MIRSFDAEQRGILPHSLKITLRTSLARPCATGEREDCLPLIFSSSRQGRFWRHCGRRKRRKGASPWQAGKAGGGGSLHREATCVRTCLRGMGLRERGCSYKDVWFRSEREGWRKGSACKALGIWTPPMGNEEPNRTRLGFFGSYKLWHWSRKLAGMGRGRKADLFRVCVNSVSTGFIPFFPPTVASTAPFT